MFTKRSVRRTCYACVVRLRKLRVLQLTARSELIFNFLLLCRTRAMQGSKQSGRVRRRRARLFRGPLATPPPQAGNLGREAG